MQPKSQLFGLALQGILQSIKGLEPLTLGEWVAWFRLEDCLIQGAQ